MTGGFDEGKVITKHVSDSKVVSTFYRTGPDGKILNRGYVIDDQGAIRSRYDKIHMFDIQLSEDAVYRESATVAPGAAGSPEDSCRTPYSRYCAKVRLRLAPTSNR